MTPLIFVVCENPNTVENKRRIINHDRIDVVNRKGLHKSESLVSLDMISPLVSVSPKNTSQLS
jgi:hypothetical protein